MVFQNLFNKTPKLFFGVGSGRCATMAFTNFLNSEKRCLCLHEGKKRVLEETSDQLIPFLTLQNYHAYEHPGSAKEILLKTRSEMPKIARNYKAKLFGDIAYNYAPFVKIIPDVFPDAKLIVFYRNGIDFVRSVVTDEFPDPTPVGWQNRKHANKLERYISLGRLRPTPRSPFYKEWRKLSVIGKNAWLWSETNKLILRGLESWNPEQVCEIRFENFCENSLYEYERIRSFLGIKKKISKATLCLFDKPINSRSKKSLPPWDEWDDEMKAEFKKYAGDMMSILGYDFVS